MFISLSSAGKWISSSKQRRRPDSNLGMPGRKAPCDFPWEKHEQAKHQEKDEEFHDDRCSLTPSRIEYSDAGVTLTRNCGCPAVRATDGQSGQPNQFAFFSPAQAAEVE